MKKNINQKPNRLINEKNPYLLQHAYNPVDWFPWGEEAFEEAKKEDKPVFLSIGYSTCHWCHVMAHESFEDEEIAGLMNEAFINIKVDREERPDVDGIYMEVCQMMTGSGGWPLTIIMTSDKKPFFAGTYFPKTSMYNRIGMNELIPRISDFWKNRRGDVNLSADEIIKKIESISTNKSKVQLTSNIFEKTFNSYNSSFDDIYGGFGGSPKFPVPHNLIFLMRYYSAFGNKKAFEMVEKTLLAMGNGGIYDHLGYGFHRYSTDREWIVPHFEKMLYDQALLAIAFIEAFQISGNNYFKNKAEEILTYVIRDMTSREGGFYTAEDADSEGFEGKYYLWDATELNEIIGEDYELFRDYYNVQQNGNFIDRAGHAPEKQNILYLKKSIADEINNEKMLKARAQLYAIREERIHPQKDDKILADWNGLMIAAFALAGNIINNENYIIKAINAVDFIEKKMVGIEGKLRHKYNDGEASVTANLDDYVFYIYGLMNLYEASFDLKYIERCIQLNEILFKHFWEDENGGFYFTPDYGEKLILRKKDFYDGAVPSGNSIELLNLLKLWKITGKEIYKVFADKLIGAFGDSVTSMSTGHSQFLAGYDFVLNNSSEIVFVAESKSEIKPFLDILRKYFIPNKTVLFKNQENSKLLSKLAHYTDNMVMVDKKTTVYLCRNYACDMPITDTVDFDKKLLEIANKKQ